MTAKKAILFVGEAVTLAHVSRPMVLAQSLDPDEFDVHFACDPRYEGLLKVAPHIRYWPIRSMPSEPFVKAIDHGWFDWSKRDVESYLAEDILLFEKVRPALVVGDYRLTLPISGAVGGEKIASLTNFHWSPYSLMRVAAPVFPPRPIATRIMGRIERAFRPAAERTSTGVFNSVRERRGQTALKDFHQLVAMGDYTLYVEPPDFMPAEPLPPNHIFLGPILWSPSVAKPSWWEAWNKDRPLIYVTLGSSGAARQLPSILQSLELFGATVVVATAGRIQLDERPNVFAADYLPGLEISALASVVVCNGGSATAYQALSQGTPVVGLWSNLDQFYTMTTLERVGVGIACGAAAFDPALFAKAMAAVLEDKQYRTRAKEFAQLFKSHDACDRFRRFVRDATAN